MDDKTPNVACWIQWADVGVLDVSCTQQNASDTPGVVVPRERLERIRMSLEMLHLRVSDLGETRVNPKNILRDDNGTLTIGIPIIRELLGCLSELDISEQ